MNCKIEIIPRLLHFKQPAGTSRGTYTTRKVWYLHFTSPDFPGRVGIGECAPLPALSCDDLPDYEDILVKVCRKVEREQGRLDMDGLCDYPSILFGLETAIRHFFAETGLYVIRLSHVEKLVFRLTALFGWEIFRTCYPRLRKRWKPDFVVSS